MIELKDLSIKYIDDFYMLLNINLSIDENTLFLGDEMSGNWAVLRLIAGIDKNYSGDIFIDGKNIKEIKEKEFNLAFVSKTPYLFNTTIDKNLIYPLKIRRKNLKINKNEIKNIVNLYILNNNLENFPKKIKNLSLSQKKIITLARAIIREPKYILIENLFENMEETEINIALNMLENSKSIIIACDKEENLKYYKNFKVINLYFGSVKN